MKILTVEDDLINAMLMERILLGLSFGFDHEIAENADKALDITKQIEFDLILMDINLGSNQRSGSEVMRILKSKENYNSVPMYAITCHTLPGDKENFLAEGFDKYFSKPVDYDHLLGTIEEYHLVLSA